jgi:hypothetical protein
VKNLARPLTTMILLAGLALTACSAPQAASAPTSAGAGDSTPSPTASPSNSSGPFGAFASAAEACSTIKQEAAAASLLPLSAAQGKTAELEQVKADLSKTAEQVPDSLKADFANLNQVALAGLSDQKVFSSGQFSEAMAPVTTWLAANCK